MFNSKGQKDGGKWSLKKYIYIYDTLDNFWHKNFNIIRYFRYGWIKKIK